jgi:hypothetical protein
MYFYRKTIQIKKDKIFYESQYLRLRNFGIDDMDDLVKWVPYYKKYRDEILKGDKELQEKARMLKEKKNRTTK